jgi:hypothetical protein
LRKPVYASEPPTNVLKDICKKALLTSKGLMFYASPLDEWKSKSVDAFLAFKVQLPLFAQRICYTFDILLLENCTTFR